MQDRVQLPESLEKALEHLKSDPSDFDLAKERATAWERVQQQGRRSLFWGKWKPFAAGLAGLAVAALAILIPVQVNEWQTASQPEPVPMPISQSQDVWKQKESYYKSLGFNVTYFYPERGLDLIYNDDAAFAVQNEKRTKLFDINSDDEVSYVVSSGEYAALLVNTHNNAEPDDTDNLYILNFGTMQVQKIDTIGDVMWSLEWNVLPAKLLFAQLDLHTQKQQIVSAEWKTGKIEVLHETNERYFNQVMNYYQSVVINNGYEIKLLDENGDWHAVSRSDDGSLQIFDINGEFIHYTDKTTLYRYNIRQAAATPLLQKGGEQRIIRLGSSESPYLISVFKENEPHEPLTSSRMRYGTLELWKVDFGGQAPKKLWEKAETPHVDRQLYEINTTGVAPHLLPDWIEFKASSSEDWSLLVNRKTYEVKEQPVKQQN